MIKFDDVFTEKALLQASLIISNKICYQRSKGLTRGPDQKTYWDFAQDLNRKLEAIFKRRNKHSFGPMLLVKRRLKTRVRDVYISNWDDRVVEVMLNSQLNNKLREYYYKNSYAYRPDRIGIDQCQSHLAKNIGKMRYIVRRDIKNYFYTIDHDILMTKLEPLVDQKLLCLLESRIRYQYIYGDREHKQIIGIPFGSSIAGLLANVYLTDLDYIMSDLGVVYYRYADDIIFGANHSGAMINAAGIFDDQIANLNLALNKKKSYEASLLDRDHSAFAFTKSVKFLGLEFTGSLIRLPLEKRRKIINYFRFAIAKASHKIKKCYDLQDRLRYIISACSEVLEERIRSVSIIDYYLNHINDEEQLKSMDRQLAEMVISAVLKRKFKQSHFGIISYNKLRQLGLESLLHRSRKLKHGSLKIPFMSIYNKYYVQQYEEKLKRRSVRRSRS